jgi:sodium/potassium/calcium exchanger 6
MLIGLGVSLTLKTASLYPEPFPVELNLKLYIAFGFLMVSLLSSLIVVPLNKFLIAKKYAVVLLVLTCLHSSVSITVELLHLEWTMPRIF